MSFFSRENILAPFSNMVNLVAIVSVAGLFLLWRLMGGGFDVQPEDAPQPRAKSMQQSQTQPARSVIEVESTHSRELVRQLEEKRRATILNADDENRPTKPVERTEPKPDSGMDDIERMLGLR
jgi:hypothetical protein